MAESNDKLVGSFVSPFLEEVNACVSRNLATARGEIENALHQRLQSCGDTTKQAKQINMASYCAKGYIKQVESVFEKNFTKFERYLRRNIVHVPNELEEDVAALYKDRKVTASRSFVAGNEDQTEAELEADIAKLRKKLLHLEAQSQQLDLDKRDFDEIKSEFVIYEQELDLVKGCDNLEDAGILSEQAKSIQNCISRMDSLYDSMVQKNSASDEKRKAKKARFDSLREQFISFTSGHDPPDFQGANEILA